MKQLIYKNSLLFSVVWAAIIFALCATPGHYIPSVSWLEMLSFDKWVHATMFFILNSLLFIFAIKRHQPKQWMIIYFLLCVLYGGLLELMQAKCFSNRSADWQDFVANSFGCIIAVLFLKKLRNIFVNISTV